MILEVVESFLLVDKRNIEGFDWVADIHPGICWPCLPRQGLLCLDSS
jgi:hypothetical protein